MKRILHILLFLCGHFVCFSQDPRKQLEELDSAFAKGKYNHARDIAEKIQHNITTAGDDSLLVEFLSTCGSLYYRLEDFEKAGSYFLQASQKARKLWGAKDPRYALAVFNLASCYKEQGRYLEAEPLYLESLPLLAQAFGQSSLEYTRCFYTLGSMYIEMSKYAEAESMCAAAVNFYKTILGETSPDYLGALGSMGVIYMGLSRYDKAEEIFIALKNYHASMDTVPTETLQVLENNLGDLYRHKGDYDKAEPALLRAVELAGNSPAAAVSLNNLALVQKALGKYAEAEASYKRALQLYITHGKTGHPDYTNPLNNLGELYRTMGRLQDAVYAFEEVIVLRKKLLGTLHPNYANALNNLALVQFAIGMYAEAEKNLTECRDIYKKIMGEKDKLYANSLNNLATVYKIQGKLQLAESNFLESIRIYKETYGETNDKYGIYLGGLGGTYRQMKRYDEAIRLTLQSLEILKNKLGELHYDHIETQYNLAETFREAGKPAEAVSHYLQSMKGYLLLIERYFPYLSEKDKTSFYFTVSNAFETFNSFVAEQYILFHAKDHSTLVKQVYENQVALKSLLLKESGKLRDALAATDDATLKNKYRHWLQMRETIIQYYRLNAEERELKGVNLPQLEYNANQVEQELSIALKIRSPEIIKPVSWKDIQAALQPGELAVEIVRNDYYAKGRWTDSVYYLALVLDKSNPSPRMVVLRNGHVLETKNISAYRTAIKARANDPTSYTAFWEPLKKQLGNASRIYFSPDGVYQQLNLYTLKNPQTGQYLIDETDIRLVSNTRDILQRRKTAITKKAEIFSYPDFGNVVTIPETEETRVPGFPHLKDLPGTKIESDSVKKILQEAHWTVTDHLQKDATEEVIKKVSSPQVLHIATHGFFLKDIKDTGNFFNIQSDIARQNPLLRSGVILAGAAARGRERSITFTQEDGILTAYEATDLDLTSTELVVLSACETGLGEILNGQGVYGLQRAFMVAGAQSLIMSLWMVSDAATQELMTGFYREWLKNPAAGKQNAFRTAQLKLREKYNSPYYWGAFVVVGE